MKINLNNHLQNPDTKAGLIGAVMGALFSFKTHQISDRPIDKAGKTALFSGAGFLLGSWIGKLLNKITQQNQ